MPRRLIHFWLPVVKACQNDAASFCKFWFKFPEHKLNWNQWVFFLLGGFPPRKELNCLIGPGCVRERTSQALILGYLWARPLTKAKSVLYRHWLSKSVTWPEFAGSIHQQMEDFNSNTFACTNGAIIKNYIDYLEIHCFFWSSWGYLCSVSCHANNLQIRRFPPLPTRSQPLPGLESALPVLHGPSASQPGKHQNFVDWSVQADVSNVVNNAGISKVKSTPLSTL